MRKYPSSYSRYDYSISTSLTASLYLQRNTRKRSSTLLIRIGRSVACGLKRSLRSLSLEGGFSCFIDIWQSSARTFFKEIANNTTAPEAYVYVSALFYYIKNCFKETVLSPETFVSCFFKWAKHIVFGSASWSVSSRFLGLDKLLPSLAIWKSTWLSGSLTWTFMCRSLIA